MEKIVNTDETQEGMIMSLSDVADHIATWNIPWSYTSSSKTEEECRKANLEKPNILEVLRSMNAEAQKFMLEIYSKDSWFAKHEIATRGFHQLYIEEYSGKYVYVNGTQVGENW